MTLGTVLIAVGVVAVLVIVIAALDGIKSERQLRQIRKTIERRNGISN